MRKRIKNKLIQKEIKRQLPVIDPVILKLRGCTFCAYYVGCFEKQPRCMMAVCAWDDEEEHFHPILQQMLPEFQRKMEKAEEKYLKAKEAYELLVSMFVEELAKEERKKDECFMCCYGKNGPCIGVCYKALDRR